MRNGFSLWRLLRRIVILIILLVLVLPAGLTLLYREVAPPATPLLVIRLFEGEIDRNSSPHRSPDHHGGRQAQGIE